MKKINSFLNGITIFQAFSIFFAYSALLSLTIQIILTFLGPPFSYGDGLLDGGDWKVIHDRASYIAGEIIIHGWNVWEFRPEGWGIVGLISAHYAFFELNKPFLLIPIFSGLHALGALCILKLMETLGIKRSAAFYSSIPYLIFPSSLLWVSQLLKDGFTLNGALLILLGLVLLFNYSKQEAIGIKIKNQILSAVLIFIGLIIIWTVRPYMLSIYFMFIVLILILVNISMFISIINKKTSIFIALILMLIQISLIAFNYSFFKWSIPYSYSSETELTMLSEVVNDNISLGEHNFSGISVDTYEAEVKQISREKVIEMKKIIELKTSTKNEISLRKQSTIKAQLEVERLAQEMIAEIEEEIVRQATLDAFQEKLAADKAIAPAATAAYQDSLLDAGFTILKAQLEAERLAQEMMAEIEEEIVRQATLDALQEKLAAVQATAAAAAIAHQDSLIALEALHGEERLAQEISDFNVNKLEVEIEDLELKILDEQIIVESLISNIDNNKMEKYVVKDWIDSKFLPFFIDNNLKRIYVNREYFYKWNHLYGSSIDLNIYLNDFSAMLGYIPRAMQILYLAPFPTLWLQDFDFDFSKGVSSLMNIVVGVEMLFIYIFLIGALCSFYIWRKKIEIWIMLLFSLYIGLIYTYAFPNIGALVRYRYASIMILAALGISAFIYLYSRKKTKLSSKL